MALVLQILGTLYVLVPVLAFVGLCVTPGIGIWLIGRSMTKAASN